MTATGSKAIYLPSSDVDVRGKRVLVRADLNVPLSDGEVSDATRLERLVPSLRDLAQRGAKVIVLSHLGRPDGRPSPGLSLRPVAQALAAAMEGTRVVFCPACVGASATACIASLSPGDVAVFENLRFHADEEANGSSFAAELALLGDIYVNDAFSVSHRAHASTEAIAHLMPAYAGPSLIAEIEALKLAFDNPARPVAAVVGGSKVSTKIDLLVSLASKMDILIVGGGMANTFLYAQGFEVGRSLYEPGHLDTVRAVMSQATASGCTVALPSDVVVAAALMANAAAEVVAADAVPADKAILDAGPRSVAHFARLLEGCKTLLWNGPLGAFEIAPFGEGTFALAKHAARMTRAGSLVAIAGGGDTVAALNVAGVTQDFTYVSTAGGAFLESLEGKTLPGIAALART